MKRSTIIALVIGGVALLLILNGIIFSKVIRPALGTRRYTLSGPSMEPTIKEGQTVRTRAASPEGLHRGEIVVYTDPGTPGRTLIHRIIALGSDEVEIRKGTVYVNGTPLSETYIRPGGLADLPPLKVPVGQVFLMGDNRGMSLDSRHRGPVPLHQIKAVVTLE